MAARKNRTAPALSPLIVDEPKTVRPEHKTTFLEPGFWLVLELIFAALALWAIWNLVRPLG